MPVTVNASAPIVPGVEMGGVRLRMHISECFDLIRHLNVKGASGPASNYGEARLHSPYHIAYDLAIGVTMVFNLVNGRIYKLVADERYKGSLNGRLRPGMPFREALIAEPKLTFDDMEEVYHIPGVKGVAIETDGRNDYVMTISIYVTELEDMRKSAEKIDAFERGQWS